VSATTPDTGRPEGAAPQPGPRERETAARLVALIRHVFLFDRGHQIQVIEETGLSLTQCKAILELGGLREPRPWQLGDLAAHLGISIPAMSRAVDDLVRKGLAERVEDEQDRRVRRVTLTPKGRELVETLVTMRRAGAEAFAATLTPSQRRKLDDAIDALMDRPDIAAAYEQLRERTSA